MSSNGEFRGRFVLRAGTKEGKIANTSSQGAKKVLFKARNTVCLYSVLKVFFALKDQNEKVEHEIQIGETPPK